MVTTRLECTMAEVNLNASARMRNNRLIDLRLTKAGQRKFVSISQENGGGYSHFNYRVKDMLNKSRKHYICPRNVQNNFTTAMKNAKPNNARAENLQTQ